ncbi:MAG: hypothetical protein KDG89_02580 [Geminicoccaceae bacterium]|nr:hypothetical protein [Geminicoccaceae bacterium]
MRRVEALEAEVLFARERRVSENHVGGYHPFSPLMWDARRLDTVICYRRQLEHSQIRLLKELKGRCAARAAEAAEALVETAPTLAVASVRNEPEAAGGALAAVPRIEPEPREGARREAPLWADGPSAANANEPGPFLNRHMRRRLAARTNPSARS